MEVNVLADKWDIDHWVEGRANTLIKGFYPTIVARETNLPLQFVFERLLEMSADDKLRLKWEIRCPVCHDTIDILDNFPLINEGDIVFCDRDQEIELSVENIYPVFEICSDYRASVRDKNRNMKKKKSLEETSFLKRNRLLVPQL